MVETSSLRLPVGIRDFAPGAAAARRYIAETLTRVFERWGFARVITPAFEYEEVLGLGLGSGGRAAALRFVEPSSGQVLALRPDITPQVARLIATRYADEPGPLRLCYEGPVFRFEQRSRSQKEVIQAGVELAGVAGAGGEVEVITLALAALAEAGIPQPTVDLAHLGLAREVIDAAQLPAELLPRFHERVARRDRAGVKELLASARGPRAVVAFAARLPELAGGSEIIAKARVLAPSAPIRAAIDSLAQTVVALSAAAPEALLHVDLGEIRGFDYYTGVRFQIFAEGSADAVVAGGRYDQLIGRYGQPRDAVGFAASVEAVADALEARGATPWQPRAGQGGRLLVGPAASANARAAALRAQSKTRVAVLTGKVSRPEARAYARRWGFDQVTFL